MFPHDEPCCERSEPASAEGAAPRVWGAESPPRSAVNEHLAGCLFNRENLALRKNDSSSFCVSPAAAVTVNCLPRAVCAEGKVGYKLDISREKSDYKPDTIISSL